MDGIRKYFSIPDFYIIFSGLLIAQVFNLLNLFILPRLYNPADFALFGLFTSFVFILIEVINLKLDIAIQIADTDKRRALTQASIFTSFFITLIIAAFSTVFVVVRGNYYFLMLPLVILAYGINQSLVAWLNSEHQNNTITVYRIIVVVVNFLTALICMYFYKLSTGLIIGFVFAQVTAALFLVYKSRIIFQEIISKKEFKEMITLFYQFPKFGVISSLINTTSKNSIIPIIIYFFGNTLGGFYTMSSKIIAAPSGLYQTAMTQVFMQQVTKLSVKELKLFSIKILVFGTIFGIIPCLLVLFWGAYLFSLIFGYEWQTSGNIASYIVLWYYVASTISPVNFLLDIYQKLHIELLWNIILLILRTGSLLIGYYYQDFWLAIILITIVSVFMNLILLFYSFKLLEHDNNNRQ